MKKYIKYIAAVLVAAAVAGCMEFISVNHPESAPVDSTFEASFEVSAEVDPDLGDTRGTVLVGVLAPVSWNPAENITVTYSSSDMPGGAVTDAPMRLVTDADLNADKKTWPVIMTERLGMQGNYEPMQWVAFLSTTSHTWNPGDKFTGTVKVSVKTGSENIKTNLAYFIGNQQDGVNTDPKYYLLHKQPFETTGGENAVIDYTLPKMFYITPDAFTWEDIVAVNFDPTVQVDGKDSPLLGAEEVYLMAEATYNSGADKVTVDEISAKTLMMKSDRIFKLYIYPHEFFGIPAGTEIEKITFWFVNKDKSVEVKNPSTGEPFTSDINNI